jgi:iron complex outermembrane receptor protein
LRATFLLTAPQQAIARNEKKTPGYAIGGLAAGATFRYKTLQLRLSLEIQNLLDQRYFVHQNRYRFINIPEPGRNLQLSAIFTFTQSHTKPKSP